MFDRKLLGSLDFGHGGTGLKTWVVLWARTLSERAVSLTWAPIANEGGASCTLAVANSEIAPTVPSLPTSPRTSPAGPKVQSIS